MSLTLIASAPSSDAAYRTALICRYLTADWAVRVHLLAEAVDYDTANPGGLSLADELFGAGAGDVA